MATTIDSALFGDVWSTAEMRAIWLAGLHVHPDNMARNLDRLHGLLLSENVMLALGRKIGRQHAHEILYEICMRAVETQAPLKRLLLADPRVAPHLTDREIDELLDPARYIGLAGELVDRVTRRV